ncbi:hypothetical protein EP331_00175 [bacterium]|nr:MAG: hypothetical protein EP331_00175 [bacterium]
MALTYDNLIELEGNTKFRKIIAFKFTDAFQTLHKNIPVKDENETVDSYNQRVRNYLSIVSVKTELERQIDNSGILKMPAIKHFLAAISTYDIPPYQGDNVDTLIDRVLSYSENDINIVEFECTKLLKAYSFKPQEISNP